MYFDTIDYSSLPLYCGVNLEMILIISEVPICVAQESKVFFVQIRAAFASVSVENLPFSCFQTKEWTFCSELKIKKYKKNIGFEPCNVLWSVCIHKPDMLLDDLGTNV